MTILQNNFDDLKIVLHSQRTNEKIKLKYKLVVAYKLLQGYVMLLLL